MWNKEIEQDFIGLKVSTECRIQGFPDLGGWRSVHLYRGLEQGDHCGSFIPGAGWIREIPRMLGKEVSQVQAELS